jgi:hypothetical protein
MEVNISQQLICFFDLAKMDDRLDKCHMSMYLALLKCLNEQNTNPFIISRADVMKLAKISWVTYHRCIKELVAYGYIKYKPSNHPGKRSKIFFLNAEEVNKSYGNNDQEDNVDRQPGGMGDVSRRTGRNPSTDKRIAAEKQY